MSSLKDLFANMEAHQDPADPYTEKVSAVYRDEPADADVKGKMCTMTIIEGPERKSELNDPTVNVSLTVVLEMHVMKQTNVPMATTLNRYLGMAERVIRKNRNLRQVDGNPLVIDTTVVMTDTTLEGRFKQYGTCVMELLLRYRHTTDDPRSMT